MKYASCYCEENIWHLCADSAVAGHNRKVLWISSLDRVCPVWCQRVSVNPDEPVWWDYHVILVSEICEGQWVVWDLDTTLGLGVSCGDYFRESFRQPMPLPVVFRIMDATYYRENFSSDRSHMRNANGDWLAAPPSWPAILNGAPSFNDMRNMRSIRHGSLLDLAQVTRLLS